VKAKNEHLKQKLQKNNRGTELSSSIKLGSSQKDLEVTVNSEIHSIIASKGSQLIISPIFMGGTRIKSIIHCKDPVLPIK
jgi:hypothetical protein